MKKGKLIILLAITSVIAGGVILTNQKKNIFTNDAQASKQLSAKEKQLAYLKEQEKDMADFVKSLSPKVDSVQFDWESMEVGQVGNGTPQGGGYMLTLRGKVNQNEQTKFMVGFSLEFIGMAVGIIMTNSNLKTYKTPTSESIVDLY